MSDAAAQMRFGGLNKYRGIGRTTWQMDHAPRGAFFVWCNERLAYPNLLAAGIYRYDLQIVGPSWLAQEKWLGLELPGIIIDHSLLMSTMQNRSYREAMTRVRKIEVYWP